MDKLKKLVLAISLGLLVTSIYLYASLPARLYLKFGKDKYGSYTVEVPYHIAVKQDCAAYKEWAQEYGPAFFAQNACPWAKPIISGEIGKFIINGVKFNIPRKYLYLQQMGGTSDGEQGGLHLAFIYPDITPLTAQDWSKVNHYEITLSIAGAERRCDTLGGGRQCDIALDRYRQWTDSEPDRTGRSTPPNVPTLIERNKELNMDLYYWGAPGKEIPQAYKEGTLKPGDYVRGDPWKPDYWIDCGANTCEVNMNYANNHISVRYTFFKKQLLVKHDELRNKIINLLNEWSENNE